MRQVGRFIADQYVGGALKLSLHHRQIGDDQGYAVAHALNVRFLWTERVEGKMTLRRGFEIVPDERVLVVEDVITTGGSTRECIAALREHDANVIGAASIIDRSNGAADVGVPHVSLVSLDVPTYSEEECPLCINGDMPYKPGSRAAVK